MKNDETSFLDARRRVSYLCQTRVIRCKNPKILEFMNSGQHKDCRTLSFPSVRTTCHLSGTDHTPCLGRLFTTLTDFFLGGHDPPPPAPVRVRRARLTRVESSFGLNEASEGEQVARQLKCSL